MHPPAADPTTPAATQSTTASSVPTVSGYRPGEIPPIPFFSVPAIDVFASNADKAVVQAASTSLASVPGVTVSPAKCDGTGSTNAVEVKSASKVSFTGSNNAVQYEDGNAPQVGSDSGANNVVSKDN